MRPPHASSASSPAGAFAETLIAPLSDPTTAARRSKATKSKEIVKQEKAETKAASRASKLDTNKDIDIIYREGTIHKLNWGGISMLRKKLKSTRRARLGAAAIDKLYHVEPLETRVLLSAAATRQAFVPPATTSQATTTPPYVVSINRQSPNTLTTTASTVHYLATFSAPVTGVDASDFAVVADPLLKVLNPIVVTPLSGATYDITVTGITGSGDLTVKLQDNHSITNVAGQHLISMSETDVLGTPQPLTFGALDGPTVVADVNGDGKADLVYGGGEDVTTVIGDGHGDFRSDQFLYDPASGEVGGWNTAIADLNNDHIQDIVAIDQDGLLDIYLGIGSGVFSRAQSAFTSFFSASISICDFNHDGIPDIFISQANSNVVGTALGNGNGTFQPLLLTNVGLYSSISAADINGDGSSDLLVNNSSGTKAYLSKGDGSFGPAISVLNFYAGRSTTLADFNGDGKLDLAYIDSASDIDILAGNGNGTFSPFTSFASGAGLGVPTAMDINGDGIPDLLINDWNNGNLLVSLNRGGGQFETPRAVASGIGLDAIQMADFDGDGREDLFFPANGAIAYGVSHVAFASQPYVIQEHAPQVMSLQPSFGAPPLNATSIQYTLTFSQVVSGVSASDFRVKTQGAVTCQGPILVTPLSGSAYTVTVNGIHGSGSIGLDFFNTDQVRNSLGQAVVTSKPNFIQQSAGPTNFTPLYLRDINGDGKLDLIGYADSFTAIEVANGNGDGTFQTPRIVANSSSLLAVGDATGDGILDLIAVTNDEEISVLPGDGLGGFGSPIILANGSFYAAAVGDFNNAVFPMWSQLITTQQLQRFVV
jgi:hypothetical protein